MSLKLILEAFEIIALVSFGFLTLGFFIPIGCTLGNLVSDKIESFFSNL